MTTIKGVRTSAQRRKDADTLAAKAKTKSRLTLVKSEGRKEPKARKLHASKTGNLKLYRHRVEGSIRKHGGKSITEKQALDAIGLVNIGALALAALVSMGWCTRDRAGQIGIPQSPKASNGRTHQQRAA